MDLLTSRQISEWEAYDKIDPIGKWRDDYQFAQLESLLVNIITHLFHDPKKGKPVDTTPLDFMVDWTGEGKYSEPKKQSVEQMKQVMMDIATNQNKRVRPEKSLVRKQKK